MYKRSQIMHCDSLERPPATATNPWHATTVSAFHCNQLTLAGCFAKFNAMNVGAEHGGKSLVVEIDDSATKISGAFPDYLTKSQVLAMLSEARHYSPSINTIPLATLAQESPVTLNVSNINAYVLIGMLMDLSGFPGVIRCDGPRALIRREPRELSVCAVKPAFSFDTFFPAGFTSDLVNVTQLFRESSKDPLSIRYHVPSDNVVVLAEPDYLNLLVTEFKRRR